MKVAADAPQASRGLKVALLRLLDLNPTARTKQPQKDCTALMRWLSDQSSAFTALAREVGLKNAPECACDLRRDCADDVGDVG